MPDVVAGSLVAHDDAESVPTFGFFEDLLDPLCTGEAGLVVRHTAGAPEVDIALDGQVVVDALVNGEEISAAVPEGSYQASGLLAGTDTVVLGPADLELVAGVLTVVYATGSVENEDLDLLVIEYEVGTEDCDETPEPTPTKPVSTAKPPTAVPAGQGPAGSGGSVAVAAPTGVLVLAPDAGLTTAPEPAPATTSTAPAVTGPSLAPEPSRTSGWQRLSPSAAAAPVALAIPAIDVDSEVVPVGTDGGVMQVPAEPWVVGWWSEGVGPGAGSGTVVLDAHLDSRQYGKGRSPGPRTSRLALRPRSPTTSGRRTTTWSPR